MREVLEDMGRYDGQLKASKKRIRAAVGASLEEIYGCGPICAATTIGQSGDIGRFASRAHFASYNATAPIEASSGNLKRHRLNPKGNRQLNWAIHMIAVTQLRIRAPRDGSISIAKSPRARPTKKHSGR